MNDLIDRAGLLNAVNKMCGYREDDRIALLDAIDTAPSVPAEVVRHGRWIHTKPEWGVDGYSRCSHCRGEVSWGQGYESQSFAHCPLCGCRMDGQGEGDAE